MEATGKAGIRTGEKKKIVLQNVRFRIPLYDGLQRLADNLNQIPHGEGLAKKGRLSEKGQARLDALVQVQKIVSCFSPHAPQTALQTFPLGLEFIKAGAGSIPYWVEEGVRRFNDAAETALVMLRVSMERDKRTRWRFQAGIVPMSDLANLLLDVHQFVVRFGGANRLKRCRVCHDWFVDKGKNQQAFLCSEKCRRKYWTRPQRRAKKAEQAQATRPAKRRATK